MSTRIMMFLLVQVHRCRVHILANCCGAFPIFPVINSSLRLLEGRVNWNQRLVTTKTRGIKQANVIGNVKSNNREVLSDNHLTIAIDVMKTQPDLHQKI
ncbi:DNA polymerase III, epsilon subunit-like protein [Arachis hypogaea]|nr:DNA polymerase III, epsilon subunit-like protein [Arachis hypogaea]